MNDFDSALIQKKLDKIKIDPHIERVYINDLALMLRDIGMLLLELNSKLDNVIREEEYIGKSGE